MSVSSTLAITDRWSSITLRMKLETKQVIITKGSHKNSFSSSTSHQIPQIHKCTTWPVYSKLT